MLVNNTNDGLTCAKYLQRFYLYRSYICNIKSEKRRLTSFRTFLSLNKKSSTRIWLRTQNRQSGQPAEPNRIFGRIIRSPRIICPGLSGPGRIIRAGYLAKYPALRKMTKSQSGQLAEIDRIIGRIFWVEGRIIRPTGLSGPAKAGLSGVSEPPTVIILRGL